MKYYKDQLQYLGNPYLTDMDEIQKVISDLMDRLHKDCNSLSIAEKDWICSKIRIIHNENNELLDPYNFPCCKESIFYDRYLLYFNNLEGFYPVKDWNGEISRPAKMRDVAMLERTYQSWRLLMEKTTHKDALLNNVSTETRHHLKGIERYCRKLNLGANKRRALEKEIVLNGKFVYRNVEAYYQENDEKKTVVVDGKNLIIDSFSYIHTLFRHFGQAIKEHQKDKSYHIEGLDYKNLPLELGRIITAYSLVSAGQFDGQKIYFKMNEKIYAIWFREIKTDLKGGGVLSEYRVQTFYPVEETQELNRIASDYGKEIKSNGFIFLSK